MTIKYAYGYFEVIEYEDDTENEYDDLPELIPIDDIDDNMPELIPIDDIDDNMSEYIFIDDSYVNMPELIPIDDFSFYYTYFSN
jgi:hypothetical protein